jgi:tRNA pseudouridine synthase 10
MRWENQNLWADWAVRALKGFEYVTFLVGTKITGLLAENEELILAEGSSKHAEPLKSEMNREVGKLIAATTGKEVDFKRPDIVVHLNLESRDVELQVASVYVYGRYRKVVRGIPQTRWPCRVCHGQGCPRCEGTGRMYPESVDELIRPSVVDAFKAEDTVFHGAGREDIDARMLGTGRPFIVEAVKPKIRTVDMAALTDDINRIAQEKVEVSDLRFAEPQEVERLKDAAFRKTYEALVDLGTEASEEKLKSVLKELVGSVDQRTPTRVSHRRSDKHRARNVYRAELQELSGKLARIVINGDSGLYIKELISGDEGRTRPSLAEVLGSPAKVLELDVVDVGGELNGTSSRNEEEDEI